MGIRGIVHVYRPTYTLPDPTRPGKRTSKTSRLFRWRFQFRGTKHEGGPGQPTKGAALALGQKRMAEVVAGMEQDPRKLTFGGLKSMLKAEYLLKDPSTRASATSVLKRLSGYFRDEDLAMEITRERLLLFVAYRQAQGGAANTINLDLQKLRAGMNLAHTQGRLLWVPKFPRLKAAPRRQFFRADELERLFAALPAWWRPFFRAAAEMGWRARSELRTRQWQHVDLVGGWVVLEAEASKTDRGRVFPMTGVLRTLLEGQRKAVDALQVETGKVIPWVFPDGKGDQLADYRKAWLLACRRAGFGKLEGKKGPWSSSRVAHDLRRTAIRGFEMAGGSRSASMAAVGHGSERMFSDYASAGTDAEALRAWADNLDRRRAEAAGEPPKVAPIKKVE